MQEKPINNSRNIKYYNFMGVPIYSPKKFQDYLRNSNFVRDIFKVLSSNIFVLILSFLSGIVTARYLGVEGKGLLTVLLVYPNIVLTISQMGIRQVSVYEIGRKKYDYDKIIGTIVSLFLVSCFFGTVLCYLIMTYFSTQNFENIMILLAVLTIPLSLIKSYAGGIYLGKQEIGLSTVFNWLPQLLKILALIIFVIYLKLSVNGALIATLLSSFPVAGYAVVQFYKDVSLKPIIDLEIMKNMIGLGSIYALSVFLNLLNYRIDIILLEHLSNATEVGLYSIGVNFAELVSQIPAAVGIVIFSRSSNATDHKNFSKRTIKLLKYGIFFSIFCSIAVCLIAPYLIPFLYKDAFKGSVPMLQLLMPGIIALVAYRILGFDMAGKGQPWASVSASLPGVISNVILNYILIPKFGGKGAAVASSISYTIMSIINWMIYKKILKKYA